MPCSNSRDRPRAPMAMNPTEPEILQQPSFEALDTLLDVSPGAILIVLDGFIVRANAHALELLGFDDPAQLIGLPAVSFLDPFEAQRMCELVDRLPQNERLLRRCRVNCACGPLELEIACGRLLFLGKPALIVAAHDLTEQVRDARRLAALAQLTSAVSHASAPDEVFHSALQALRVGADCDRSAILLKDAQGEMQFVAWDDLSDAYRQRVHAHSPWLVDEDARPLLVSDAADDADLAPFRALFEQEGIAALGFIPIKHRGKLIGKFAMYYRRKHSFGDEEVQLAMTVAGHVALAIERQRAERELKQLNNELESRVRARTSELEQANRELASFSYSVSHDLRAPLRSLNGFAHVLIEDYADKLDATGRQHLDRILSATVRIDQLTVDLLRLADINRSIAHNEDVDLSALCESILARYAESEPDRMLHGLIQPRLHVVGDRGLLTVMMENLLGNAWKYSAGKPVTEIRLSRTIHEKISIYCVSDNGAGFDMRYAGKLFKPFERLHGADYQGSGIGLAIVERIVHRFKGRIWADSKPNEGARFYFTLWEEGDAVSAPRQWRDSPPGPFSATP